MAKARRIFLCKSCGSSHPRWMGKCPDCGSWDALEETTLDPSAAKDPQRGLVADIAAAFASDDASNPTGNPASNPARPLSEINASAGPTQRLASGIDELDRVLGASPDGTRGLVPGSVVLIGGEPGIGKSTLLLQAAGAWASGSASTRLDPARAPRVLYVSSEESAEQIKLRAQRLGLVASSPDEVHAGESLYILAETNLARIIEQVRRVQPAVVVIDSVQMIYKADVPASPGSVTQLRRCSAELAYLAKLANVAILLVGHVTKDGTLAGPRLLEHLVDVVLTFEGDRYHAHRVVRAVKNRFGTTLEIGLFEMGSSGLREASDGAALASITLSDKPRPGSCVCPVLSGSRCVLVELQALTATGFVGAAKRKASGVDPGRMAMLIAVLEQHAEIRLADRDVFTSAVGGLRVNEPGADLPLLLAIASAERRHVLPPATAAFGEVGLGGEIRPVPHTEQRLREAERLGYSHLIVPRSKGDDVRTANVRGLKVTAVRSVAQALELLNPAKT
ncbi:MAG: DNA repair protein RadA [Planctomycetota bacterium]|nr:DNA repair protein RadA [Planctomycetota bacterium]